MVFMVKEFNPQEAKSRLTEVLKLNSEYVLRNFLDELKEEIQSAYNAGQKIKIVNVRTSDNKEIKAVWLEETQSVQQKVQLLPMCKNLYIAYAN